MSSQLSVVSLSVELGLFRTKTYQLSIKLINLLFLFQYITKLTGELFFSSRNILNQTNEDYKSTEDQTRIPAVQISAEFGERSRKEKSRDHQEEHLHTQSNCKTVHEEA